MLKVSHFRNIKTLTLTAGILVAGAISLSGQSLNLVLKSPASYHHKRVSLVGILRGDGPMFELFENATDAIAMKAPKSIYVVAPATWRKAGPYDLRRARVTGIVDANRHGIWGNPCALIPEKIEVISGPVASWPDLIAVFRNEENSPVELHFGRPPTGTTFTLQPKEYVDVSGWDGPNAEVAFVKVLSLAGLLVAKEKIVVRRDRSYYDPANAALYYRIKDNKIERVSPHVAKHWGWRR